MTTYMKVVVCAVLAFLVPIVGIVAGELSEHIRWIPYGGIVCGGLAMTLYCAIVQFCVARKGHGLAANWPALVAMLLPLTVLLVFTSLVVWKKHPDNILTNGLPMLISGYLGSFLGVVLAARVKRQADANTTQR